MHYNKYCILCQAFFAIFSVFKANPTPFVKEKDFAFGNYERNQRGEMANKWSSPTFSLKGVKGGL
jgi:hypothetical protein